MSKQASGEDRISALSDDIICNILSNLYVEESARTSILSKRWRKMWLLSPITISDESIVKQSCMYCFTEEESSSSTPIVKHFCMCSEEESSSPITTSDKSIVKHFCMCSEEESSPWIINVMSHIISFHSGPIRTCHFNLPDWREYKETLINLLKILTLKGIQNLLIDIGQFEVPCFVFECDSLVNVHLRRGSMPAQLPVHKDVFPNLRKLSLTYYHVNKEFLVNLLSSGSIIELAIHRCYDLKHVVIESDTLQKFYFGCFEYDKLTIKDAPNLEAFKGDGLGCSSKVVILNAPKLKVLSRIDMGMLMLQLGNYQFDIDYLYQYIKIRGEITYMPSLQSLDIAVHFNRAYELKAVPYILMCFPCLETLEVYIKDRGSFVDDEYYNGKVTDATAIVIDDDYNDRVNLMPSISCLNHHLKNVRVSNYPGRPAHLDFIKLIVANAKVLKTLTIVYGVAFNERRMKSQIHFLMQNRASKMLQIEFVKSK